MVAASAPSTLRRWKYIPSWGMPAVSFEERHLQSVGFIFRHGHIEATPSGTFFTVSIPGAPNQYGEPIRHRYVVTAAHVIHKRAKWLLRMRSSDDSETVEWVESDWHCHADTLMDLAVAVLPDDKDVDCVPLDLYGVRAIPNLGRPVYFMAMVETFVSMVDGLRPMVRAGTMGRRFQSDVEWTTNEGSVTWRAQYAHILDTRSIGGFSGSPCYMLTAYPYPEFPPPTVTFPPQWDDALEVIGVDKSKLGSLVFLVGLIGMFAAHDGATETGIVIPTMYIDQLLNEEKLQTMRLDKEKELFAGRSTGPVGQGVKDSTSDEYDRFEELTRRLVQVPKTEIPGNGREDNR